jgi:hypothetical protein
MFGKWPVGTAIARGRLLLLSLLLSASGVAGQVASVPPDSRVRLLAPSLMNGWLTGTVITATLDTLRVRGEDQLTRPIPVSSITELERSLGESRVTGAFKGALWGTGVGLGLSLANVGFSGGGCDDNAGECIGTIAGVLLWTSAATVVGTVIGGVLGSERWEGIPLNAENRSAGRPSLRMRNNRRNNAES